MFWECFYFNCKINIRRFTFLLAAAASLLFSVLSQQPYFEYYQLINASDLQRISGRLPTDATVPAGSEEQIALTIESVESVLREELKLPDPSGIITALRERLSVKADWSIRELDALWAGLVSEYSELTVLMPGYLSNCFANHFRRPVTQEELFSYAYAERDFSDYVSVEFGQSLSLIISLLFAVFFSTVFLDDVKPGMADVLHVNVVSPRKMIYAKYLAALVMAAGCICVDIMAVNVMQLLYVENITIPQLLVVWGNVLLYCIPTVVFLSSASVLLCVLLKNAAGGIAVLLLANFISSPRVLADGSRERFFMTPFIVNLYSFFDSLSREEWVAILWNRILFCLMGIGMLELTVLAWKRYKSVGKIRRASRLRLFDSALVSPKSFCFYNAKIVLNKGKLAALSVIFFMPCMSVNANTDVVNISRSILLMTGWASVLLFADVKSVEYTDHTIDLYRLSSGSGLAVGVRFLICVLITLLFTTAVFFLSLLRIAPMSWHFEYMADIFTRMMIACMVCACFLGSVTMTVAYVCRKTWSGLAVGLLVNVLLSQIKTKSILNLYWFYYFPGNEEVRRWLISAGFYALLSVALLIKGMRQRDRFPYDMRWHAAGDRHIW